MFCPQCGQQQMSEETRFCSRCGFTMIAVADLISRGGALPDHLLPSKDLPPSPRKKGVKQGLFIFLLGFLVVPLVLILSVKLRIGPLPGMLAMILLGVGGLLRMAYAALFESNTPGELTIKQQLLSQSQNIMGGKKALPPETSIPVNDYVGAPGNWRDTNDLTPTSVTENTTKLFGKDQ